MPPRTNPAETTWIQVIGFGNSTYDRITVTTFLTASTQEEARTIVEISQAAMIRRQANRYVNNLHVAVATATAGPLRRISSV